MRALPLILLAIWLIMGFFVNDWCNCYPGGSAVGSIEPVVAPTQKITEAPIKKKRALNGLRIADGRAFSVNADEQIRFPSSGYEHVQPRPRSVTSALAKTANYLKSNPHKALTLTGLYKADELNNSTLPNLGLARANNLKKVLIGLGTSSAQILTAGAEVRGLKVEENQTLDAIRFSFTNLGMEDDQLAGVESRLRKAPRKIYFQSNKEAIIMDKELRNYFADLLLYLDRKPDAKINSIGHTDSRGDRTTNIDLGQGRADFVKNYLVRNGANPKQIITGSAGPDKPIATNSTALGRSQNRRVEITIK